MFVKFTYVVFIGHYGCLLIFYLDKLCTNDEITWA